MNIVIINGQNHKGSTRMIARELAEKVGGEIMEFFLPRDFDEPCLGCWSCFKKDMTRLSFLDHYGTRWMVHRPKEQMFRKQGVCVATAAGGGMKGTNRDMYDSLLFWGVPKIYQLGFGVRAAGPDEIPEKILRKIHSETDVTAEKIRRNAGRSGVSVQGRFWFYTTRFAHKHFKRFEPDYSYWEQRGWHGKQRPWKTAIKSGNLEQQEDK